MPCYEITSHRRYGQDESRSLLYFGCRRTPRACPFVSDFRICFFFPRVIYLFIFSMFPLPILFCCPADVPFFQGTVHHLHCIPQLRPHGRWLVRHRHCPALAVRTLQIPLVPESPYTAWRFGWSCLLVLQYFYLQFLGRSNLSPDLRQLGNNAGDAAVLSVISRRGAKELVVAGGIG